jgi:hypothetical protein
MVLQEFLGLVLWHGKGSLRCVNTTSTPQFALWRVG